MKKFSNLLLNWYALNKRDLPWRTTKNPYFIWLSEIILQQTRVDQGLDYYLRFVEAFPTIKDLAKAGEEKILKLWQGLGYYSRARNLHAAAQFIEKDLKGRFPDNYNAILQLKGVGEYTAAAIASFSYNQPHAVVDGNVFRVLSRIFGIQTPIDSGTGKKEFHALAHSLLDKKNPSQYNQAIMEFGALQCVPKNPDCHACCFHSMCHAFAAKQVEALPVKTKATKQRKRFFNYLVLKHKNTLLLNKRTGNDIWKNLYDFPLIESSTALSRDEVLGSKAWSDIVRDPAYTINSVSREYKHILSHQVIYARFWEITLKKPITAPGSGSARIIRAETLQEYAIPRLIESYLHEKMMPPV